MGEAEQVPYILPFFHNKEYQMVEHVGSPKKLAFRFANRARRVDRLICEDGISNLDGKGAELINGGLDLSTTKHSQRPYMHNL